MQKISYADIQKSKPSFAALKKKKRKPIYVVLDNIRSLYNVGAIFRTSDAVLVKKIFLCGITGYPPRKEISKTALGAEKLVPFEYHENVVYVVKKLKKKGIKIVAVELAHGADEYNLAKYKFPICFIFGHEVHGIADEVMKLVDMSVSIPMLGRANSLNVAVAFGIILYNALLKFDDLR